MKGIEPKGREKARLRSKSSLTNIGLLVVALVIVGTLFTSSQKDKKNPKELTIAAAPGPYGDMFDEAIKPYLEQKLGYKIKIIEYSDSTAGHKALVAGDLDAEIFGHLAYEESMQKAMNVVFTPIYVVPTAGAGIYSKKHKSFSEIKSGATFTIANDITNLPRALRIIQAAGLIKLDPKADPYTAQIEDIASNPYNIKFNQVDPAQATRTLDSVDFAVVHGNIAFATGLDLKTALYTEKLDEKYKNAIVVLGSRAKEQFVKDIQTAASSKEFWDVLNNKKSQYVIFQKPARSIPDKFYTDQGLEIPKTE